MNVVCLTCDKYSYIVPLTLRYLKRAGMPYPIQVVTNTLPIDYPDVVYLGPDEGWSSNLLKYVQGKTEPFILWMEEGICTELDRPLLELGVRTMEETQCGLVRLYPCPGPTLPYRPEIGEIDKALPYAISCQVSIWNPQTFRDILKPGETPWDFEIHGSQRALHYLPKFLGTYRSAVSYKEYTRRGQPNPDALAWIAQHQE